MPLFNYKALDSSGKEIKSTINTETVAIAKQKIRAQGLMLLEISEQSSKKEGSSLTRAIGQSINITDLALMTRQLATLIKAKIQIVEALSALIDQIENQKLKVILSEVRAKVNEGFSLAKALSDYPKVFNNVFVNMVDAGEASGNLDVVLLRLADFTEAQMKLKNRIQGAMTYPVIMLTFGFIMMNVIFIVVIPKITKIFVSMKRELPLQTKISIWISNFMQDYWYLIIAFIVIFIWGFKKYIQTESGMSKWHKIMLKSPLVGNLVIMINVSRFCSTLATMLNSGVPILIAMKIVKNLIPNVHIKKAIDQSRTAVAEGSSMTGPLVESRLFPPMVTHMIKLGERSGELEPMLKIVAENYEEQVESKLSGLTSVLEPVMMIFMGLAVGFIVFSVVVPMMQINSMR